VEAGTKQTTQMKYSKWTEIEWDGNPSMKLRCWRKSFGRGHVSIGIEDFLHIVHSFGASSDRSFSGTRWRPYGLITVETAKAEVDRKYNPYAR
jgi:hypothetical protein